MRNFLLALSITWLLMIFNGCNLRQTNPVSSEVLVSLANTDAAEPAIAADSEGNIYVLYVEHGADKTADVYLQKFSSNMKLVGERVRINPQTGGATAWRGDPPTVRIGKDGTVYVGWTARLPSEKGSANDLYLSISRDGGHSFEAPVKVNDDTIPGVHGMHSFDVDENNRVSFAWLDERYLKTSPQPEPMPKMPAEDNSAEMKHLHAEPNREVYFAVSMDGGKTFSANRQIAGDVCPCCKTAVLAARSGKTFLSWRQVLPGDFRHIAVTSTADNGASFAPPVIVNDDRWEIAACPISGPSLAAGPSNTLGVFWYTAGSAGQPGFYLAESKDDGKSFGPRKLIESEAVSGTPTLFYDPVGKRRFVFPALNGQLTVKSDGDSAPSQTIESAALANAASSQGKIFVVFIKEEAKKRSIWLAG